MTYETGAGPERLAEIIDLFDRYRRSAEWLDDHEDVDVA